MEALARSFQPVTVAQPYAKAPEFGRLHDGFEADQRFERRGESVL